MFGRDSCDGSPRQRIGTERAEIGGGLTLLSGTQAVLWLAKEAGAFQRHGLDVDLIYISTGTKMVQALVGGDIKIAQVGGAAPLGARLRGAEIKIIAVAFIILSRCR